MHYLSWQEVKRRVYGYTIDTNHELMRTKPYVKVNVDKITNVLKSDPIDQQVLFALFVK